VFWNNTKREPETAMEPSPNIGKYIVIAGIILVIAGLLVMYAAKIPFLGRLPGDIRIERKNFSFYFPLTTSILLSILLSLVLYLVRQFRGWNL
jgi:H+/Cl- antiporter ClcA